MATVPIKIIDGIPKIFPFEKHYITLVLKEKIEEEEKNYLDTQERIRVALEGSVLKNLLLNTLSTLRMFIYDLKVTLERVENLEEIE